EIVKRFDLKKAFVVLPKRWIVERSFAWIGRCRRLARDVEATTASSKAWLLIAHMRRLIRKIAKTSF
ncbi:transposase, partial [Acetobacteraceae bacterium ESL0697]|nr:transposase [Acetobacteraceae bacterium ESL0697]